MIKTYYAKYYSVIQPRLFFLQPVLLASFASSTIVQPLSPLGPPEVAGFKSYGFHHCLFRRPYKKRDGFIMFYPSRFLRCDMHRDASTRDQDGFVDDS